ncbi:MAG: gamma-glutamylcyclotransferase [Myxococcales bacterium]|nr:gamma-glutamylcyclotransferase [Myxococcales bacterium]
MSTRLFVYGTLMHGGSQAGLLGRALRTPATTVGSLWHLPAGYPALSDGDDVVHGELVVLPDARMLDVLDAYEGIDEGLYVRVKVDVRVGLRSERAWAYRMANPRLRGGRRTRDGRYKPLRSR